MTKIGTISIRHRIGIIFLYGISETCRQYYGCTRERVCLGFVFLGKLYGGAARFTDIGMAVLSYYKRLAFAILKKLIILDCCFL